MSKNKYLNNFKSKITNDNQVMKNQLQHIGKAEKILKIIALCQFLKYKDTHSFKNSYKLRDNLKIYPYIIIKKKYFIFKPFDYPYYVMICLFA